LSPNWEDGAKAENVFSINRMLLRSNIRHKKLHQAAVYGTEDKDFEAAIKQGCNVSISRMILLINIRHNELHPPISPP
jgi:hypothetical protein